MEIQVIRNVQKRDKFNPHNLQNNLHILSIIPGSDSAHWKTGSHLSWKSELQKGAEERTCLFSHRHCSKPIYRFEIRLESEPKNPAPNFFNFPEKKLDFTIDHLDNNGNEYIYVSVPLVAFKELPDYIKGNANYQFER